MKPGFRWTALVAMIFLLPGLGGCGKSEEPFYMRDLAALRQLPEEDLLRMRDDILVKAAKLPDQRVEENAPVGIERATAPLRPMREGAVSGTVQLWEKSNGEHVICLDNFRVPLAPDLRLECAGSTGEFFELGSLGGNVGRQCFDLPGRADGVQVVRVRVRSVIFDETIAEADFGSR